MARFVTDFILYQSSSSIEYFAVANMLCWSRWKYSIWYIQLGKVRTESTRRMAWRAALRRTNGQNQITERGLFASHPWTAGRNIQTIPPIQIRAILPSRSLTIPYHQHLPLSPLTLSFSALAIWRLARTRQSARAATERTPHTDIHGFIWGFWLEGARKRPREHRVVLPSVTGTPTTSVETHFKVAGCVAELIRLLSDFANYGRG